jgi:hypothetical protein
MARWKAVLLGFIFLAVAVGLLIAGWFDHVRFEEHAHRRATWTPATGDVTGIQTVEVVKGKGTTILGRYTVNGATFPFQAFWGRNTWEHGRWVPPSNTPAIGSNIQVFYNPANPSQWVVDTPARQPFLSGATLFVICASTVLALLCWFTLPRR